MGNKSSDILIYICIIGTFIAGIIWGWTALAIGIILTVIVIAVLQTITNQNSMASKDDEANKNE